jgi:hypothetical protein
MFGAQEQAPGLIQCLSPTDYLTFADANFHLFPQSTTVVGPFIGN